MSVNELKALALATMVAETDMAVRGPHSSERHFAFLNARDEYRAAANPAAILALLAERDALAAENERLRLIIEMAVQRFEGLAEDGVVDCALYAQSTRQAVARDTRETGA